MAASAVFYGITGYVLARKGVLVPGLADVHHFAGDALPFHGRLVGAHRFLRVCLSWRHCAVLRDVSKATKVKRSLTIVNE